MTPFLAHLPVERLGWVLIHSLWQFLVIALVVRLLEQAFAGRSSASVRYVAGVCGLAAMTAAPVVTWFFIPVPPAASARPAAPGSVVERTEALPRTTAARPVPTMTGPVPPSREWMDHLLAENSLADSLSAGWKTLVMLLRPWLPILVTCWLIGMSFCSLRPLVGWLTLRRLGTVGVIAVGHVLEESARRIAARLCLTQKVSVLRSTLARTRLTSSQEIERGMADSR